MAEQKVSNERKKELEQLDPFQENLLKVIAYGKKHKNQLLLITGAVLLVAVVFSGIMYSFKKAENNAAVLVNQTLIKYDKAGDSDKGYEDVKDNFKTIFSDYANTTAGKLAMLKFAKICYDASRFDQSYSLYKQAFEEFKDDALMENLILASLGHVSLAKKEFGEAKKYFLQIETGETDFLKDEARFALALLDEAAGNIAESKKMYEKIATEYENSMYKPIAESRIAGIK